MKWHYERKCTRHHLKRSKLKCLGHPSWWHALHTLLFSCPEEVTTPLLEHPAVFLQSGLQNACTFDVWSGTTQFPSSDFSVSPATQPIPPFWKGCLSMSLMWYIQHAPQFQHHWILILTIRELFETFWDVVWYNMWASEHVHKHH